jgi:hypothetical protein
MSDHEAEIGKVRAHIMLGAEVCGVTRRAALMAADDLEIERRLDLVLEASTRLELLCEPPGCSPVEFSEAKGKFDAARLGLLDFVGRARRGAPEPAPSTAPTKETP